MKDIKVDLKKSNNKGKKYKAIVYYTIDKQDKIKVINFGASGYSDYTKHKDEQRKDRYIERHKSAEDWTKKGVLTAGFWSKWLLWNKPTIDKSKKDISDKFGIKFL